MIKQLVEHIVKHLVDQPDKVSVQVFHDEAKSSVEVKVSAEDFKRVIGKEGVIVKSIRSMLYAISPDQKNISVDITQE